MQSIEPEQINPMKGATKILTYIPVALLALSYGWHGISGLLLGHENELIVSVLGLDADINAALIILVGLLDCCVAIALLFKDMLLHWLSWQWLLTYVGIWPIVPRTIQWIGGGDFAWMEVLIYATVTALAYYLHKRRTVMDNEQAIA